MGSLLILIHVGEKTKKKEDTLQKAIEKLGIDENQCRVIWAEGSAVETILRLCKLNIVDLLILGALKKENILNYYLGSVARKISRKAKCSVLLLTHPSTEKSNLKKIIVNGVDNPKTIHSVNTAMYIAGKYNVPEITIAKEVNDMELAMTIADDNTAPQSKEIKKHFNEEEKKKLLNIINKCEVKGIKINDKIIHGKPGYAISKFAREKRGDLLLINSPDTHLNLLDRIFTHDIEYILADLPCDVLIVHSRV
jgi:nucleotide-binding universal stress UspA family protein